MTGTNQISILYVTQFFHPETIAAAFRATDNSLNWVKDGANVTVFTSYPNYPEGRIHAGYTEKRGMLVETFSQVRVIRNRVLARPNIGLVNKGINALSFLGISLWNARIHGKTIGSNLDIAVVTSGTVFAALAGRRIAKAMKIPFVFELRDITYRQLIGTGADNNSWKVKLFKSWELGLCHDAAKVVVVTNGLKSELVEDGIAADKIEVIPNGVDDLPCVPDKSGDDKDRVLRFGYFGSIGYSQNLSLALEYLNHLNQMHDLEFQIVGAGAERDSISESIADRYPFAKIDEQKAQSELVPIEDQCDFCLVSLLKDEEFSTALPSKLFRIMARGIPVLFIGPKGEASELIESNCAGIALTGNREEDIHKLVAFFKDPKWPDIASQMAHHGRALVRKEFDRQKLSSKYLNMLAQCVELSRESTVSKNYSDKPTKGKEFEN